MSKTLNLDLEEFRLTLPPLYRTEVYHFMGLSFDVVVAKFLIQQHSLPLFSYSQDEIATQAIAAGVAYPRPEPHQRWFNIIREIDDTYIEDCLCGKQLISQDPLILLSVSLGSHRVRGKTHLLGNILIDGGHRLRYAYLKGSESLSACYIPSKFQSLIQL